MHWIIANYNAIMENDIKEMTFKLYKENINFLLKAIYLLVNN